MIGIGQSNIDAAKQMKKEAEEAVSRHEAEVSQYAAEANRFSSLQSQAEYQIQATETKIRSIEQKQRLLAKKQSEIVTFQNALRKCVHFLGKLAGKIHVAEVLSRDALVYDELEKVLEDILLHVYPLMGQETEVGRMLLSNAEVRGLIGRLKYTRERLPALTNATCSNWQDSY